MSDDCATDDDVHEDGDEVPQFFIIYNLPIDRPSGCYWYIHILIYEFTSILV